LNNHKYKGFIKNHRETSQNQKHIAWPPEAGMRYQEFFLFSLCRLSPQSTSVTCSSLQLLSEKKFLLFIRELEAKDGSSASTV
jgi:hypothetical protein